MSAATCRHCEQRPAASAWGLCERCDRTRGVRTLYQPRRRYGARRGPTPADEAILERLRRRASARLPLFPRDGG